ncbi:hypothetical protein KQX54_014879 [Cotesia glomerata]|uniref:Uncharacterized protein n=1 Tax=Cotesia glomerata TaxID=32391 RepID=A0AAV7IKZ3_COTGL|nr:hypothetical protein KQX54_014879 [Cotesia glomerata]
MNRTLFVIFVLCCAFAAVFCAPSAEGPIHENTLDDVSLRSSPENLLYMRTEDNGFMSKIFYFLRGIFLGVKDGLLLTWDIVRSCLNNILHY